MSRYVFDPISREFKYAIPTGAEIPNAAFNLNSSTLYIRPSQKTSPLLIALLVTIIVLVILAAVYLGWLLFVKTESQNPTEFFSWITGR
jgi:hypothetical protein